MKKLLASAAVVAVAVSAGAFVTGSASADEKLVIAVVPKNLNNPFFDQAKIGCEKAVAEIGADKVECYFTGPGEHGGGDEQAQIVADLIAKGVDGIGVSAANAAAIAAVLPAAKEKGIPVITWDSDLLPENKDLRVAYIGTHNYDIGVGLAKVIQAKKPNGGKICIQSGGAAAANHNERMQGIRDTLAGVQSKESPGDRLTGQNGWTEVDGCPLYTNDDFPLSVQQLEDTLNKYPDLDAFTATGGFAQFLPDANKAALEKHKGKIADGSLVLAVADTLQMQLDQLKEGYSTGNVGQRPMEMGYKVIYAIYDMKNGKPAPADPTYTGLDTCTKDNADTCTKGGN
ncbi:MAG: substrate-binding domain-containing protein [Rhizobiales bacterium]|nr:substrate-binding domain-containing protein [Hyphomicrobiales bacterium]